ncbi:hypothetical protein, partial [Candidatus Bandiella numerosa]|uniref:hypothetical protein n=1 Tax=Candidatus Bandiella numerosa TaxID=2570586 RepID=UPI001F16A99B
TLPSASFRQLLTKLTLPQLMDSSISAHEGLEPSTLTSCTAHKMTFCLLFRMYLSFHSIIYVSFCLLCNGL